MPWTREENILCHTLSGDKFIQNCFKIDAIHIYDHYLLLREETKKIYHYVGAKYQLKKNIEFMSLAHRMHFLLDEFQMTAIALVLVLKHHHINGLEVPVV